MFLDDSRWRVFDPSGWQKYFHLLPQDVNLYAEGIPQPAFRREGELL